MSAFDTPVHRHMVTHLETARLDTPLAEVARRLDARGVSALPLVDDDAAILGVVSRTDLVHVGRITAPARRGAPPLVLPDRIAGELAGRVPITCRPDDSLRAVARIMLDERIHRVFVVDGRRLLGVISTLELIAAVRDSRIATPIREIMTSPVITIGAEQPLSAAIERLDRARITGLVVVDEQHWPIGVFTQVDALHARDLARGQPVEDLVEPAIICMPAGAQAHRAAAQAARLDVRRVIACENRDLVGMVTGLDFAKLVAA